MIKKKKKPVLTPLQTVKPTTHRCSDEEGVWWWWGGTAEETIAPNLPFSQVSGKTKVFEQLK